jgi:uncharacterized protein YbjT (DUF2867 family)
MAASNMRTITVFGGTGFLGRRVVRHLRSHGFSVRIASRHPDRGRGLFALENKVANEINQDRRRLFGAAAMAFAATQLGMIGTAAPQREAEIPAVRAAPFRTT